ncbi:MAG: hypothetical protein U0169_09470 [Polyangiaceae bacterium]
MLVPGGQVALLIADSAVERTALRAEELLLDAIDGLPFDAVARASQDRPHFHGPTFSAFRDAPRREHVLLVRKR